ncbi:MAG TPA: molybdopterin-dependent oxidoreductase [Acidobacteriaceae bacterium]
MNEEPEKPEPGDLQPEPISAPPEQEKADATASVSPEQQAADTTAPASPEQEIADATAQASLEQEAVNSTAHSLSEQEAVEAADAAVLAESRKHTRRSFVVAAAGTAAGYGLYHWIDSSPGEQMQPELLRQAFLKNAALSRALFRERALAPTYPLKRAENLRVNGVYGLKRALAPESWRLQVVGARNPEQSPRYTSDVTAWQYRYTEAANTESPGHDTKVAPSADTAQKMSPAPMVATQEQKEQRQQRPPRMPRGQEEAGESYSTLPVGTPGLLLTLDDLLQLPRHELVTQFKCIEGWSQIVHWAGVRMADFLDAHPPQKINGRAPRYVYMETPEGDYYTGYDMDICRHPQTLLVTEMMGAPLTQYHGAPLRLHMPTKYGYKQIKRIALIAYTDRKPDDYWTKLGYDWYAGL